MATIQFKKGDEYLFKLAALEAALRDDVCGPAIYGAAGIVADEIRNQLEKIPTDESYGTASEPSKGPKKIQKIGLESSLGISSMQDDGTGYLQVKIGFDGYNKVKTNRWPSGQPNQVVARSAERGTSYMKGSYFVKKAVASCKKRAIEFMRELVDTAIEQKMK